MKGMKVFQLGCANLPESRIQNNVPKISTTADNWNEIRESGFSYDTVRHHHTLAIKLLNTCVKDSSSYLPR